MIDKELIGHTISLDGLIGKVIGYNRFTDCYIAGVNSNNIPYDKIEKYQDECFSKGMLKIGDNIPSIEDIKEHDLFFKFIPEAEYYMFDEQCADSEVRGEVGDIGISEASPAPTIYTMSEKIELKYRELLKLLIDEFRYDEAQVILNALMDIEEHKEEL